MKSEKIKSSNKIHKIRHSSTHLHQSNLDYFTIHLAPHSREVIKNHVTLFKKKFDSLKHASSKQSPIGLTQIVMEDKNPILMALSQRIVQMLCDLGVALLKDFPMDLDQDEMDIATFIFGCYLGIPMYNNRDKIYIWPIISRQIDSSKSLDGNIRYGNTSFPLSFHTDTTTFAGLLCLQSSQMGGENELISTVAVHNRIFENRKDLLEVLYAPFFIDRRGEQREGDKPYAEIPIFGMNGSGQLMTHWTQSYTREAYRKYTVPPLSSIQEHALEYLITTIEQTATERKVEIKSEPGDFLLCNNNLIFHNRKPFIGDRHLLRIWIHSNRYQSFPHMFGYPCV